MVRMETDRDVEFWKGVRMSVFQRFNFGSKIVEILQNMLLQYRLSSQNCFRAN